MLPCATPQEYRDGFHIPRLLPTLWTRSRAWCRVDPHQGYDSDLRAHRASREEHTPSIAPHLPLCHQCLPSRRMMSRSACPCCCMDFWGRRSDYSITSLGFGSTHAARGMPASSTSCALLEEGGWPNLPLLCTDFALAAVAVHCLNPQFTSAAVFALFAWIKQSFSM